MGMNAGFMFSLLCWQVTSLNLLKPKVMCYYSKQLPEIGNHKDYRHVNICKNQISSLESHKGAINIQRCSVENQKGDITVQSRLIWL